MEIKLLIVMVASILITVICIGLYYENKLRTNEKLILNDLIDSIRSSLISLNNKNTFYKGDIATDDIDIVLSVFFHFYRDRFSENELNEISSITLDDLQSIEIVYKHIFKIMNDKSF